LEQGGVETKFRNQDERQIIPISEIVGFVKSNLKSLEENLLSTPIHIPPME
jgi:hypothetical protein